ncbi:hypothetical protein D3C86_1237170 [compost metagenome]
MFVNPVIVTGEVVEVIQLVPSIVYSKPEALKFCAAMVISPLLAPAQVTFLNPVRAALKA